MFNISLRMGILFVSALLMGAADKEPEGYRVTAYDSKTHEWTITRTGTFDGEFQKKKLVVVCQSFVDADGKTTVGPDACYLRVGRFMVRHVIPIGSPILDFNELAGDLLMITEGPDINRTAHEFFYIKKEEIVTPR